MNDQVILTGVGIHVVERKGLQNLVRERQLVRSTRLEYDGEQKANNVLKPLIFPALSQLKSILFELPVTENVPV